MEGDSGEGKGSGADSSQRKGARGDVERGSGENSGGSRMGGVASSEGSGRRSEREGGHAADEGRVGSGEMGVGARG